MKLWTPCGEGQREVRVFVCVPSSWYVKEKKGKEQQREKERKDSEVRVFFSGGFFSSLVWFLLREEIIFVVVEGGVRRSLGFGRWKKRKKERRKWRSSSSSSRQGNHCRSWIRTVPRSLTSQFYRGWIDMWRIFSPLLHMLPFISSAWRIVSG